MGGFADFFDEILHPVHGEARQEADADATAAGHSTTQNILRNFGEANYYNLPMWLRTVLTSETGLSSGVRGSKIIAADRQNQLLRRQGITTPFDPLTIGNPNNTLNSQTLAQQTTNDDSNLDQVGLPNYHRIGDLADEDIFHGGGVHGDSDLSQAAAAGRGDLQAEYDAAIASFGNIRGLLSNSFRQAADNAGTSSATPEFQQAFNAELDAGTRGAQLSEANRIEQLRAAGQYDTEGYGGYSSLPSPNLNYGPTAQAPVQSTPKGLDASPARQVSYKGLAPAPESAVKGNASDATSTPKASSVPGQTRTEDQPASNNLVSGLTNQKRQKLLKSRV